MQTLKTQEFKVNAAVSGKSRKMKAYTFPFITWPWRVSAIFTSVLAQHFHAQQQVFGTDLCLLSVAIVLQGGTEYFIVTQ